MRNLDLGLRAHRRITPLGMSTLSWLNGEDQETGQHQGPTSGGRVQAHVMAADTRSRIPESVLDAAHAVARYYTERQARSTR